MTPRGDNGNEMSPAWLLDDETIEAIVAGDEVDARFERIVAFARQVEALGDRPAPPATPALEAVLVGAPVPDIATVDAALDAWAPADLEPDPLAGSTVVATPAAPTVVDLADRRRWRTRPGALTATAAKLAGLGVVAKVGLGTSVAFAGVVGAGAVGVLPAQASHRVRAAIEVVTPVDFGDDDEPDEPSDTITTGEDPAGSGDREPGGPGESDGLPGPAGGDVSGEAPGPGRPPVLRGEGSDGQDRPRDTRPPPTTTGHAPPPPAPPPSVDRPPHTTPGGDDQGDDGEGDDEEDDQGDGGDSGNGNGNANGANGHDDAPGRQRRTTTTGATVTTGATGAATTTDATGAAATTTTTTAAPTGGG